jgi:hypothetical protein
MANIKAADIEYFESYSKEILSKFQRVRTLVNHGTSSGDYHEELIRAVLKTFFPRRYSVKKGFIYNSRTEVSNQLDIMVIDENTPNAYIFQEGDFAIVLPHAVIAVMEIKTTMNREEFKRGILNIASAKRLMEFRVRLIGILFGYQGSKPSEANLDTWFKEKELIRLKGETNTTGDVYPDAIAFLKHGCLLTRFNERNIWTPGGLYYRRVLRTHKGDDSGWQLAIMLAMIIGACEQNSVASFGVIGTSKTYDLIKLESARVANDRYSFGKGKHKANAR